MSAAPVPGAVLRCASCGEKLAAEDQFCEACGAITPAGAASGAPMEGVQASAPAGKAGVAPPVSSVACSQCGGAVEDGYCTQCGAKARTARDHWSELPARWLGGVCDRGIVHARNEDAIALAASPEAPLFGVMVVCDGVTSAPDSDRASLAAARAACQSLLGAVSSETGSAAAAIDHLADALRAAAAAANAEAVGVARILGDPPEPPSCTFVAAVVAEQDDDYLVAVGWCGDSRAYWVPDVGDAEQFGRDHSLGTEMIDRGMSVAEAEADPASHTITRWLGADSLNPEPEVVSGNVTGPGWLAVVSDGMWNYASSPADFAAVLHRVQIDADPVATAEAMVGVANDHGGHDNISVALARLLPAARPPGN